MKLITISLLLLFSVVNSAISQERLEKLGLISELVYLKNSTENTAIRILKDSTIQESTKIKFIDSYNTLKTMSDQWILQLIADMSRKKSTKKFKRLNQILTERSIKNITQQGYEKKPIKIYLENLKIIYEKHQELLSTKRNIVEIDPLSIKQITDVLTSISSI